MTWISVSGLPGKVYVPEDTGSANKKHACQTCFACQWCDESRCRVCRGDIAKRAASASMRCCDDNTIGRHQQTVPKPLIALNKLQRPNPKNIPTIKRQNPKPTGGL